MTKRRNELSIISVIFMLLVIFIHAVAECVDGYETTSIQFAVVCSLHRLSSFVVQGFIFLSGVKLFLNFRDDFSYRRFYISRLKRVVIPYLIVFSLFYVYFIATRSIEPSSSHFIKEMLTGGLVGHFYFVAIICQFYILMPLWRLLYRRGNAIIVIATSLALMILCKEYLPTIVRAVFNYEMKYNSRLFTYYLFYFVAGIFAGKYYEKLTSLILKYKVPVLWVSVIIGLVDCGLVYVIRRGLYYPTWAENWHILYCVAAILCTFAIVLSLTDSKLANCRFMNLLDSASYNVYLIHPLFIFFIDSVSNRLGITSLTLRFIIKGAFALVFAIGACVIVEMIKEKRQSKVLYYLSPFVIIPAAELLSLLMAETFIPAKYMFFVSMVLFAIVSFLTAQRSKSMRTIDWQVSLILPIAMFAFMFVINYLDAGETYSRFDLRHAWKYATLPHVIFGYVICFASGLIGSIKNIRNKQ